jgi:hypothetical protein
MLDRDWLKEPDPSGEPVLYVSIPKDAKLTPDIKEALDRLSVAMNGLRVDAPDKPCNPLNCRLGICLPMHQSNCLILLSCRIKE